MWELIRANRRKSWTLMLAMALLLLSLGYALGELLGQGAGPLGLLAAWVIWISMSLAGYFAGGGS